MKINIDITQKELEAIAKILKATQETIDSMRI